MLKSMVQSESGPVGSEKSNSKRRNLQVLFEIELSDGDSCPLSDPDVEIEDFHNQTCDGVCYAEMTVRDDDGEPTQVVHTTSQTDQSCLCLAFSDVRCVPRIRSATEDVIVVEVYLSDREAISELVDRLKAVAERVSLRRLTTRQQDESAESSATTIDLSHLTTKQREAAILAVSEGYYESPRETTLDHLATKLGISNSALSQRLNAVEAKLATAVFEP
jgi:predicted DNA binding protein